MSILPPVYLNGRQLAKELGVSTTVLYTRVLKDPSFPKAYRMHEGAHPRWALDDVRAWKETKRTEARS